MTFYIKVTGNELLLELLCQLIIKRFIIFTHAPYRWTVGFLECYQKLQNSRNMATFIKCVFVFIQLYLITLFSSVALFCVCRRVMELLVQDWSLSPKLRLPAISRLQKVHNVDVTLQVLKSKGVDLKDEHGNCSCCDELQVEFLLNGVQSCQVKSILGKDNPKGKF